MFVLVVLVSSAGAEDKLTASDSGFEDWFAYELAIDGDTSVVGAQWA